MAAVQKIAGVPFVPARLLPLLFAGVAIPLAHPSGVTPVTADWVLALTSAVLSIAGGTWPWAVLVGQSALVVGAAAASAHTGREVIQVLAAFALVELLMRREGRKRASGVLLLAVVTVIGAWQPPDSDVNRTVFWNLTLVCAATLLGVHVWSLRLWMRRGFEQVREHERRQSDTMVARAAERTAIARELHDLIAHHVASIVLRVGVARHVAVDADPRLVEVLDDVYATGNAALTDLRELVGVLRDPSTVRADPNEPLLDPADLPGALAAVVTRISQAGLAVEAEIDPMVVDLDSVRRLAVLRVAQEGLTNALKHARNPTGARLRVLLDQNGSVDIEVCDDGVAPPSSPTAGHGLTGLRERVEVVGGRLTAGPGEAGWRLHALLPATHLTKETVR